MRNTSNRIDDHRMNSAILQGKRSVVFGGGGSIGAAVAREFAAEGAEVFLADRTKLNVEEVQKQIISTWKCRFEDLHAS